MFQFSLPMPYTIEYINKILDINNEIEKSKITNLYGCLPSTCELFTGFEQSRNFVFENYDWNYWKKLIEYMLNQNCDFIYLLNSPMPLDIFNPGFSLKLEKLENLLNELRKIGVKKLRVAAPQLMTYISKHYTDFKILASTSLEYKTICEYQNFIEFHPEVKQIVPSHDINKNFKLLVSLRKTYPDIDIELMLNEGCLPGCPHRIFHEMVPIDKDNMLNNDICLSNTFCKSFCNFVLKKYPFESLTIGTYILPWELKEYEKIGIKNFKLVGRDGYTYDFNFYLKSYKMYLKGIDNIKNVENFAFSEFTHHLSSNNILKYIIVKDYKKFLPDIRHFVKKGHLCASKCGVECTYCYRCAEKIQKVYQKKLKEKEKMSHFIPACKIT